MQQALDLDVLAGRIRSAMHADETSGRATQMRSNARAHDLVSDWEDSPAKMDAFTRLVIAAQAVIGPGSTLETGVCRGGSSALLVDSAPAEAFHIAIDPFGLPSQSYANRRKYGRWQHVRATLANLTQLGRSRAVTVLPYVMSSQAFIAADLLQHETAIRIVHLDGDHAADAVAQELAYFRRRIAGPAVFILDDHDEHFPGVEQGLAREGAGMARILHEHYDFPGYGRAGFSAWLHRGSP